MHPLRTFVQNPHNYEPVGLKAREAQANIGKKKTSKLMTHHNKQLAEQLAKRKQE